MSNTKPLRCQKCGKPLDYVTVLAEKAQKQRIEAEDVQVAFEGETNLGALKKLDNIKRKRQKNKRGPF